MKRHAGIALLFLASAIGMAAAPENAADKTGAKKPVVAAVAQPPAPDAWNLAVAARLVEASLEALRDGRIDQHEALLKESLATLPDFAPARWHSGYVRFDGRWAHIDQVPYLTSDSPTLHKYAELREKADGKNYPKATTAEAGREYPLDRQRSDQVVDDKQWSYRTAVNQPVRGGTITIPATRYFRDQTRMWGQVDTYANEKVRLTNTAGYSPGYARAQESLARWCQQNGLPEEGRVHWALLLVHEPTNREAAHALGLIESGGRFLTKEQVERARQLERDVSRSFDKWQDKLAKLQHEAASPDEERRNSALAALRAIDDPDSVFALEALALWQAPAKGQRAEYVDAFERAVIAVIRKFKNQSATESLVRFAVLHSRQDVREAAADGLKGREPRTFVPLLLAGLTMPIQYEVKVVEDERGQKQFQAGAVQEHDTHVAGVRDTRQVYNGWHLKFLTTAAMARVKQLQDFNLQADQVNRRIVAALLRSAPIATDGPFNDLAVSSDYDAPNPKRWWEWWYYYNEQYVSDQKPYYGYEYDWSTTAVYDAGYRNYKTSSTVQDWYVRTTSCFLKGTPVWTLSGPRPIEDIKVGDRVLSQHPETGELTYKGVLATTVRPPSEMLTIRAGKTTLTTTLGHPFFVVGKGWRMAKQLKVDDLICAEGRTLQIRQIDAAKPVEAYNLMVADFGTYFVGSERVLVHDNTPIPPARLDMPGLLAATK